MELDDLKKGWNQKTTELSKLNQKNMEQLEHILKQKTAGALNSVKGKFGVLISYALISVMVTVLLSGFAPWLMGNEGPIYAWPTTFDRVLNLLVALLLTLTFIFFYWLKYTAMETGFEGQDIRNALGNNIKKLRRSLRHEVWFVVILFFGWVAIARAHSQVAGYGNFMDIFRADVLLAIGALAVFLGAYLLVRYRHYVKYIKELNSYLEEFEGA